MFELDSLLFSTIESKLKIKPETKKALNRLGIYDVRDLLFHIPSAYSHLKIFPSPGEIKLGERVVLKGEIQDIESSKRARSPTKIYLDTKIGNICLIFFNKIPVFIFNSLKIGKEITIDGTIDINNNYYQIAHPEFVFDIKSLRSLEARYPLTYTLNNRQLCNYIKKIFDLFTDKILAQDPFFKQIFRALKGLHFPENDNVKALEKHRQELAKYELLSNQINLVRIREDIGANEGRSFEIQTAMQQEILEGIGFSLTPSQSKALQEIEQDQTNPVRMVRMLQGDVGAGKTLVALMSIINVLQKGMQSVLMAPTEILARQHYNFFTKALGNFSNEIGLLTSKTKNKSSILQKLKDGEIKILIGTHAIFQEKVIFQNLAYIIIDEQHKFGVQQRLELINKADKPDLLVMTATPIPRSLTLTMFGDMENSKLIGKPRGRKSIITNTIPKSKIEAIIDSIQRKLDIGEKIYWVCTLIEKDEETDQNTHLTDIYTRAEQLKSIYPEIVGIIHGKMKNEEKDFIMEQFKNGAIKILVATTVIEVGIDVPDATLIIIENAEQFGLSSLHQLRGRVGRSDLQSHSILLYEPSRTSNIAKERLKIMRESEDGFYIAEQDLILRGGGEILGTKQSGEQRFVFADLAKDTDILIASNKEALNISKSKSLEQYPLLLDLFKKRKASKDILE